MPLQGNLKKLYLMGVLSNAQFHLVVYTLFLLAKGFTLQQFFLIEAASSLVILLMEIPTGTFSDRFSRKWSLVIASLIGIPVVPVIILSNSFWVVLGAMSLGGLSMAFVSGTDTAILYDTLKALGREREFKQVMGHLGWYTALSMAFAGIAGGLLAQINLAYAWWAYFAAGLLAIPIKLALIEPPFEHKSEHAESYLQHLGQSLKTAFTGSASYFVLYAAGIWFFFSIGFWLWQPYLKVSSVPVAWFGAIYAVQNVIGGYTAKQAYRVESRLGMRTALLAIPLGLGCVFLLESRFLFAFGFIFIFLHSAVSGLFSPLLEDYVNHRIPSARRATVLSIKNMLSSLLFMTLSPLAGGLVDSISLPTALLVLALGISLAALVFHMYYARYHPRAMPAPSDL
jgi:MFS family permease